MKALTPWLIAAGFAAWLGCQVWDVGYAIWLNGNVGVLGWICIAGMMASAAWAACVFKKSKR